MAATTPVHPSRATRIASAASALANCLTAGGVFTFPIWSPSLARSLHLSSSRLNLLASCAILGEYAVAAPFGQLADRRGPGAVSLCAAVLFAIGFGVIGWRQGVGTSRDERGELPWKGEWIVLGFCYFLVGCGTAASYFSGVISLVKSAPARHSGLAIGVPCAVFGLSPLFLSSLASFFTSSRLSPYPAELDASRYLLFLAVSLFIINGIGAVAIRGLPWEDNLEALIVEALEPEDAVEDVERLLPPRVNVEDSGFSPSATASISNNVEPDERTALLRRTVGLPPAPPSPPQTLSALLSTASFWLLGGIIFFSTGPCEAYMASLGAVLESLVPLPLSTLPPIAFSSSSASAAVVNDLAFRKRHIALLSVANTVSRFVVGAASDWLSAPSGTGKVPGWGRNVRLLFSGGASATLAAAYGWGGTGMRTPAGLWVVTLATGISYGTVFTLTPALVRTRWGTESFGRNWGLLTWYSALGALLFTPLFGFLRDLASSSPSSSPPPSSPSLDVDACFGPACYRPFFALSAASAVLAVGMVGVLGRRWRGRL
ncbi:hypothetical protein JCM8547_000413 [Rhodosporidiobolus lusitaniae]